MGDVLSRRRRFAVVAVGSAGLAAGLLACSAILGIEDKPLRGEADTSAFVDATGDSKDAGPDVSTFCTGESHDFCDDFDVDGEALGAGWSAPAGFTNPIIQGDSGFELTTMGNSPPKALLATTGSKGSTTFSILVNQLRFVDHHAGKTFDGVRVALDLRVDTLAFTGAGGPVMDAGASTMLGILRPDSFPPKGIAILLTADTVQLDVSDDVLNGSGARTLADINGSLNIASQSNNWVRVELFVGDRDRAAAEGYDKCLNVAPGLVAAATLGKAFGQACVPVTAGFGPATWAETPALLIGSLMFAPGNAAYRIDNVVADFYAKK